MTSTSTTATASNPGRRRHGLGLSLLILQLSSLLLVSCSLEFVHGNTLTRGQILGSRGGGDFEEKERIKDEVAKEVKQINAD